MPADLDAMVTVPPFEADQLFDSPSSEDEEPPAAGPEPEFIGGNPASRFAAETLEELASAIRAGEIPLPDIDSSAGQPAVLAAVLAALLSPRR